LNAIFKVVKKNFGSKLGIFPYRYLAVVKISGKSGANICSTPLVSSSRGDFQQPKLLLSVGHVLLSSFFLEQIAEIQKTSLARILCDNADDVNMMQPDAFTVPSER